MGAKRTMSYERGAMEEGGSEEMRRIPVPPAAGECSTCVHARALRNRRGSVFVLCGRAATDEAYARYPRLPVVGCPGHDRRSA